MIRTSSQIAVRATYMRGGTSKGIFFTPEDLPEAVRDDRMLRDALLMRVVGSPDPYGKHIDGMGGATSSTSKVVLVSRSRRADCDVDYWFGAVSVERPVIDWSGNCGNLTAAVAPFAIARGLVDVPAEGGASVRIWQANIGKQIIAHVPMRDGQVQEIGDFELDGVSFPAAEIKLEFLDPAAEEGSQGGAMFPSGRPIDVLEVPGLGRLEATLITAGNPTIFVDAAALGFRGTELQPEINHDEAVLARCESLRALGAVAVGLARTPSEATEGRPHTPKLAFVAPPTTFTASNGRRVDAEEIDLCARILSMGKLHHAMTGTGAIALAVAAAIPGTVVSRLFGGDGRRGEVRVGHPSGVLTVGAVAACVEGAWRVERATMSRSARRLMDGHVFVPSHYAQPRS